MHALRLLGLGIVFGLLLVGIAAKQDLNETGNVGDLFRISFANPGVKPAAKDSETKKKLNKIFIDRRSQSWFPFHI